MANTVPPSRATRSHPASRWPWEHFTVGRALGLVALAVLLLPATGAKAETFRCPSTLRGGQPRPLKGVTVYDGQPKDMMSLVPAEKRVNGELAQMWAFSGSGTVTVVCSYAGGGAAPFVVPQGTRQCTLTGLDRGAPIFSCR